MKNRGILNINAVHTQQKKKKKISSFQTDSNPTNINIRDSMYLFCFKALNYDFTNN